MIWLRQQLPGRFRCSRALGGLPQPTAWSMTARPAKSEQFEEFDELKASPAAQTVIAARQSELETFTLESGCTPLKPARGSCDCLRRQSRVPGARGVCEKRPFPKFRARLKTRRLFTRIQDGLCRAIGPERLAFIEQIGGPLKIVSDAPIEWLPIQGLPLSLRYDCSRINATPGNLMMGCLTHPATITLQPVELQKLVVLTAFADNDPLKNVLTIALRHMRPDWENKVDIAFKEVRSTRDFIDALNAFDGYIMIFDGHGVDNSDEPIGKLMIGREAIDVWELRGKVRVPPIAIQSALTRTVSMRLRRQRSETASWRSVPAPFSPRYCR